MILESVMTIVVSSTRWNADPPDSSQFLSSKAATNIGFMEVNTLVLWRRNDRFVKKLLFSLSKTSFLRPEGLLKAPLGDPSED